MVLLLMTEKLYQNLSTTFFINIGPTLAKSIPITKKSPIDSMGVRVMESLYLKPVTCEEINNILVSLKYTACGWDSISAVVLRLSSQFIVQPLSYICNLSLTEGIFPDQLKLANVIPLYKSDDPMLFNHYRPVSLLCVLSKIFEKVMYSRLLDFLETFKVIYDNQFGFRKKRSTYMALMILMDKITKSLENGEFIIGVFLDFSKAFDTVNHDVLLQKLHHYGIRGSALKWFQSYLSDRQQYVTYNGEESSKKGINCGVPQGSILGPLLLIIYINDISNVCQHMMSLLFADDTNLFQSGKDVIQLQQEVEADLNQISEWLKINQLSLNIKKTHFIVFTNKNVPKPDLQIAIDGHRIDETDHTKFLGVIIDCKLTWKKHISYITGKIAKGIGVITKARKLLDKETLVTLYYTFIYPYLCYCNHVWGNTFVTYLEKLFLMQKKIVRIIHGVRPRTHTKPLFEGAKILNIYQINKYLIGKFMFNVHNSNTLDIFTSLFAYNSSIHEHNTRQSTHLHVPLVKRDLSKTCLSYRGAVIWNDILKHNIKINESQYVFCRDVKDKLMQGVL